jgi:hypothetical protein
MDSNNLTDA